MPNQFTYKPKRALIFVIGPSVCYVPLTSGHFALIEVEDADLVAQYDWHVKPNVKSRGKVTFTARNDVVGAMHRFLCPEAKDRQVDHRNCNPLDNRRQGNLRPCTREQNMANRKVRADSVSGLKGVSYRKDQGKWRANIIVNKKNFNLGTFDDPISAKEAYDTKAQELLGEFYCP